MKGETYWHLCAYESTIALNAVLGQISAINDSILTILNNSFILPMPGDIVFAAGFGVTMTDLQINTPSFRQVGLPQIGPINAALAVPSPVNIWDLTQTPLRIPRVDTLEMDASNSGAAAAMVAFLGISWGRRPTPPGVVYRLKATATITAIANTWTSGSLTMTTNLPQGQYAVVGMTAFGTNLLGARLIFPGASWRPGCIAINTLQGIPHGVFTGEELGLWGIFENVNLPNLEIFANGANTAQTVWLDIVRIGDVGAM